MKFITRNTDYAVRALCFIAQRQGELTSARELVKVLEIPHPFLRKILQTLNREGFLHSQKGKGGGFTLARAPERTFLLDLVETFQGPLKLNECIFKKAPCPYVETCKLRKRINDVEKYVISELASITLSSLSGERV
jgi:Rrf2 family protein